MFQQKMERKNINPKINPNKINVKSDKVSLNEITLLKK
jgi:hypothetical protein